MPGILDLESADASIQQPQPAPKSRHKKLGYFLGAIVSTVAAILVLIFILLYIQALVVRCWMSLGCTDTGPPIPPLLALAGYLLLALFLAALAQRIFKTGFGKGLLLNVAPLVILIALLLLFGQYQSYSRRSSKLKAARTAISDAPSIHLGDPFVKKIDSPNGGVIIFVHVPFTVSQNVQTRSLAFLATLENSPSVKFSDKPDCNSGYQEPPYGFDVVDREYSEPLPSYETRRKIVSRQLELNKQYYLLQERHFGYALCRVSDYQDFDPKQLQVTLTTRWAEETINEGGE